jgi:hypothetical protein
LADEARQAVERTIVSAEALEFGFFNELGVDGSVHFLTNVGGLWLIR